MALRFQQNTNWIDPGMAAVASAEPPTDSSAWAEPKGDQKSHR